MVCAEGERTAAPRIPKFLYDCRKIEITLSKKALQSIKLDEKPYIQSPSEIPHSINSSLIYALTVNLQSPYMLMAEKPGIAA